MSDADRSTLPEGLARRLGHATPDVHWPDTDDATADHGALADAGLAVLADALVAGDDADCAFALLTADALITAACVAAAEGPLPDQLGAARFAELLEDA
jgi:hypothetical protein